LNNLSKITLRSEILAQRRTLSYDEIHDASQKACVLLINTTLWQKAQHIAFYIAHDSEIDPKTLVDLAHAQNKTCYLPALASDDSKHLVMIHYQPGDVLSKNRYGIHEPMQNTADIITPTELDLVIMPLVAFDKTGTRLGMGAGYYDRTFAFLNQPHRPKQPQLIGFAYGFQQLDRLDREKWDVGLDYIFTDQDIITTKNPQA